VEDHHIVSSVN